MKNLLIIKGAGSYYRFKDGDYLQCEINKASVFPIERVAEAKDLCTALRNGGIADAALMKLTIVEEPYLEG